MKRILFAAGLCTLVFAGAPLPALSAESEDEKEAKVVADQKHEGTLTITIDGKEQAALLDPVGSAYVGGGETHDVSITTQPLEGGPYLNAVISFALKGQEADDNGAITLTLRDHEGLFINPEASPAKVTFSKVEHHEDRLVLAGTIAAKVFFAKDYDAKPNKSRSHEVSITFEVTLLAVADH